MLEQQGEQAVALLEDIPGLSEVSTPLENAPDQIKIELLELPRQARPDLVALRVEVDEQGLLSEADETVAQPRVHPSKRAKTRETLCPPKPRELQTAWSMTRSRLSFGT